MGDAFTRIDAFTPAYRNHAVYLRLLHSENLGNSLYFFT